MKQTRKKRTFEGRVDGTIFAHHVMFRWWDIIGPVTDETLQEEAEQRARECIAEDYRSGELNHEGEGTSATGWWEIDR